MARTRPVLTEEDVRRARERGGPFEVPPDAILTPGARDALALAGTAIGAPPDTPRAASRAAVRVAVASDHGARDARRAIAQALQAEGYVVADLGPHVEGAVDYPDTAMAVAMAVSDGEADFGIALDGAGIGSAIAANKVPRVRAATCWDVASARNSREHNHANVLCLGGGFLSAPSAVGIARAWLATPAGGGRHERRARKIEAIEARFFCRNCKGHRTNP